jgi:hypothetical protein
MKVNAYFNIWSRWAFEQHPDWRIRDIDGKGYGAVVFGHSSRFGVCCLNSPGYRDYVKAQMVDLAATMNLMVCG